MATLTREQAELAYNYLFGRFTEHFPYGNKHSDEIRGGYITAMVDLAIVAFGLNAEEAMVRVSEDFQDYAASLG